jgi:hypothetical protein
MHKNMVPAWARETLYGPLQLNSNLALLPVLDLNLLDLAVKRELFAEANSERITVFENSGAHENLHESEKIYSNTLASNCHASDFTHANCLGKHTVFKS